MYINPRQFGAGGRGDKGTTFSKLVASAVTKTFLRGDLYRFIFFVLLFFLFLVLASWRGNEDKLGSFFSL